MLQLLRKSAGSWIVKGLLVLLALSFAVWGIGDIFRSQGAGTTVASIGRSNLSAEQLRSIVDQEIRSFKARLGDRGDIADTPEVRKAYAYNSVSKWISQKLYLAEAADLGLLVPDSAIRDLIAQNPIFQDDTTKKFSAERFRSILQSSNLSEAQYVALLREEMVYTQLAYAMNGGMEPPEALMKLQFHYENARLTADILNVPSAKFASFGKSLNRPNMGNPSDADLKAHYEANIESYAIPEMRSLKVLTLSPEKAAQNVKLTEADLQKHYEDHKAEYAIPERRDLRQAVFDSEEKAKDAAAKLKESKSREDTIKQNKYDFIKLADSEKVSLPEEIADAAFQLPKGGVSGPLQSTLGWHVVIVDDIRAARTQSFAEVKGSLERNLKDSKSQQKLESLSDQLQDEIASGTGIEAIAKKLPVDVAAVPFIDRNGYDASGKIVKLPTVQSSVELLNVAFNTSQGKFGGLTERKEGGYFVVFVDKVAPKKYKEFAGMKAQVRKDWLDQDAQKSSSDIGQYILALANGGKSLSDIAKMHGLNLRSVSDIARDSGQLEKGQAASLFNGKPGKPLILPAEDGVSVAVVQSNRLPKDKNFADYKIGVVSVLKREISQDIAAQFQAALQERHKVRINQGALDQLY